MIILQRSGQQAGGFGVGLPAGEAMAPARVDR
jgi:hypothetical protein